MRPRFGVFVFLALLSACATGPRETGPEAAAVKAGRAGILTGSPESLRTAARALEPYGGSNPQAADLAGLGRYLFTLLYPDAGGNPFPADAGSATYGGLLSALQGTAPVTPPAPDEEDVFRLLIPCLVVLNPSAEIGARDAQTLDAALRRADALSGGTSVLPPYLRAALAARRAAAGPVQHLGSAFVLYRESFRRDSSFYPGLRAAAAILLDTGANAEAIPLLRTQAALFPRDPMAALDLARVLFAAGEMPQALDASARAILLAPDDPRPTLLRARAFAATGNWYQSVRVLSAFLAHAPDSREAWLLKARVQADDGDDTDGALATLEEARSRFPEDAELEELAGRILLETGRQDLALDALGKALRIEPDRLSTLRRLLTEAVRTQRWIPAQDYVTRILARDPTPDDLLQAYRVSWNLDDFARAAAYARSLLAARPGSSSLLLLARAVHALHDDAQTASLVEEGLRGGPPPAEQSGFLALRAALEAAGNQDAALKDLRMALVADPDNRDALLAIADLLTARRDYRRALNYLKHAASLAPDEPGLQVQIQELAKQAESEE